MWTLWPVSGWSGCVPVRGCMIYSFLAKPRYPSEQWWSVFCTWSSQTQREAYIVSWCCQEDRPSSILYRSNWEIFKFMCSVNWALVPVIMGQGIQCYEGVVYLYSHGISDEFPLGEVCSSHLFHLCPTRPCITYWWWWLLAFVNMTVACLLLCRLWLQCAWVGQHMCFILAHVYPIVSNCESIRISCDTRNARKIGNTGNTGNIRNIRNSYRVLT